MKKSRRVALRAIIVWLSVLVMFAAIPVAAIEIVPNENDSIGVYYRDYTTGEETFISWEDIPDYDYESTYDCLTPDVVAQCRAFDAQYFSQAAEVEMGLITEQDNGVQATSEVASTTSNVIVHPYGDSDYLYSGVVLLVLYARTSLLSSVVVPVSAGSGFVVGGSVIVTAQHCFEIPDKPEYEGFVFDHVQVYFGVDFLNFNTTTTIEDYPNYRITSTVSGDYENYPTTQDWCVAVFNGSIDDLDEYTYIFNCYTVNTSVESMECYSLGYPGGIHYRMEKATGVIIDVEPSTNVLRITNVLSEGMSGGPTYANVGGRSAIGINSRIYTSKNSAGVETYLYAESTLISSAIFDVICDVILDS